MSDLTSNLQLSDDGQVVTIFGVRYDIELFRHLGVGPIGSRIEIVARDDGMVTLRRLPDETTAERQRDFELAWEAAELILRDGSMRRGSERWQVALRTLANFALFGPNNEGWPEQVKTSAPPGEVCCPEFQRRECFGECIYFPGQKTNQERRRELEKASK